MASWQRPRGRAPARKQGESTRTQKVRIELAAAHPGSYFWKTAGSEFSVRGLPDLFGCVDGHLYGIEVKVEPNWFEDIQIKRLRQLSKAGACAGGLIWSTNLSRSEPRWWWVHVEDLGHKGDRRREKWVKFNVRELIFFRSEEYSTRP